MRTETVKILTGVLGISLMAGAPAQALTVDTFTTGKDWVERMSPQEKFMSIFVPTVLFRNYNVPFQHSVAEYISAIDKILFYNPRLETEDVANIFASAVYKYEPQSRPALESMELQFLRGHTRLVPPHLLIESEKENPEN